MKSYLNRRSAKRLILMGGLLYVISAVLNAAMVGDTYGTANSCHGTSCSLHTQHTLALLAEAIGYTGIAIFVIGLVLLLVLSARPKK